ELTDAALPLGLILHQLRTRRELWIDRHQRVSRSLPGEVGRRIFFLGADLLLRLDLQKAVQRAAITAIRRVPKAAGEGHAIIRERQRHGGERAVAMRAVGVVLGLAAQANLHVCHAMATFAVAAESSK